MNVGIVTLPLHTNYGGILQAWALQTAIERLGHASSHVFRHLLGPLILYKDMTPEEIATFQQHTDRFVNRYIRCDETPVKDIAPDRYDAFVVGSDQIWRHRYAEFFHLGMPTVFLDFARDWNVRRISYAPSFGIDRWEAPESDIPLCSELLKKFDAVSCREESGVRICRDVLGVEAKLVIDPTVLVDRADYEKLVEDGETVAPDGDMMVYVLDRDEEKDKLIDAAAERFGLTPFVMNDHPDGANGRVQPPVEQWLRGIRDAKLVIADSFHALVFSILFRRPFVATGNVKRGLSRIDSLLKLLGLEDHFAATAADFDTGKDYSIAEVAYDRLVRVRGEGLDFLQSALSS